MLLCSDCGKEVGLAEFPVHDECLRLREWNLSEPSRIDDAAMTLEELKTRIDATLNPHQVLFDALRRDVEAEVDRALLSGDGPS